MKTSIAFKRARVRIATGDNRYICHALQTGRRTDSKMLAKAVITIRIASNIMALEDWLARRGILVYTYLNHNELMREYRLRWLDSLIAEFQAKGD